MSGVRPLVSWKQFLHQLGISKSKGKKRPFRRQAPFLIERLEARELLAYTSDFSSPDGRLSINILGNEVLVVGELNGNLELNGQLATNPLIPVTEIRSIRIVGDNSPQTINLTGVDKTAFSNLTTLLVYAGGGDDNVRLGNASAAVFAGAGNDTVLGGDGNDAIYGEDGDDVLFGGMGDDRVDGGSGNNIIHGDSGDDRLFGSRANDVIVGGSGNDLVNNVRLDDAPVSNPDSFTLSEDSTIAVQAFNGVLHNDENVENNDFFATLVTGPRNGHLQFQNDGSFSYRPNYHFVGVDDFFYQATTGNAASPITRVSLVVNGQNHAPIAQDDVYTTQVGQSLSVLAAQGLLKNDSDPDGNSAAEIIVSNAADGTLSVLRQGSRSAYPTVSNPLQVVSGDINKDGITDLVTVSADSNEAQTYLGRGDGTFLPLGPETIIGTQHFGLSLADVNQDGNLDLITTMTDYGAAGEASGGIIVRHGDGTGGFAAAQLIDAPPQLTTITATDLDGDGHVDLLTNTPAQNEVDVYWGDATGSFATHQTISFATDIQVVTAVDTDSNGRQELVVSTANENDVLLLKQTSPRTFSSPESVAIPGLGVLLISANIDGNSDPDLIVSMPTTNEVAVVRNFANSSNRVTTTYSARGAFGMALGDVDGDGTSDLVVSSGFPVFGGDYSNKVVTVWHGKVDGAFDRFEEKEAGNSPMIPLAIDLDKPTLAARIVTQPPHGTLTPATDGSFIYTPSNGFAGTDQFQYVTWDGAHYSEPATVNIRVNRPPIAQDDNYSVSAGMANNVPASQGVLANDSDPDAVAGATLFAPSMLTGVLSMISGNQVSSQLTIPGAGDLAVSDLNGDGRQDVVVSSITSDSLAAYVQDPGGTFRRVWQTTQSESGAIRIGVTLADMNHDGRLDVLEADYLGRLELYLGFGDGTFAATPTVIASLPSDQLAFRPIVADLDGDQLPDVVVPQLGNPDGGVSILWGYSAGHFQEETYVDIAGSVAGAVVMDVDRDGRLDIVAGSIRGEAVVVIHNDGNRELHVTDSYSLTSQLGAPADTGSSELNVIFLTKGDFDGDHGEDLAISVSLVDPSSVQAGVTPTNSGVYVLRHNGANGFDSPVFLPLAGAFGIAVGDANGDGRADIAAVPFSFDDPDAESSIKIWYSQGDQHFSAPQSLSDSPLYVGFLAFVNRDNPSLTASLITAPSHGSLTLQPDGSFTYTPAAGFTGTDQFQYQASDGVSASASKTVTLQVDVVPTLRLNSDTGLANDFVTTDPLITGEVGSANAASSAVIEWRKKNDTTIRTATIAVGGTSPGTFGFNAFSSGQTPTPGTLTFEARYKRTLPDGSVYQGPWAEISFTYVQNASVSTTASLLIVGLSVDSDSSEKIVGAIVGRVYRGDVPFGNGVVRIDPDSTTNNNDDDYFVTADGNGYFRTVVPALVTGPTQSIRAAAIDPANTASSSGNSGSTGHGPNNQQSAGDTGGSTTPPSVTGLCWTSLTYDISAGQTPRIRSLRLAHDDGAVGWDRITRNPTVKGSVLWPYDYRGLHVEFSWTNSDADFTQPGHQVGVDSDGNFSFDPVGLAPGDYRIRARAVYQFDYIVTPSTSTTQHTQHNVHVTGPTMNLWFRVEGAAAPVVTNLSLLYHTNEFTDAQQEKTSHATFIAWVDDGVAGAGVGIDFYEVISSSSQVYLGHSITDRDGKAIFSLDHPHLGVLTVRAVPRDRGVAASQDLTVFIDENTDIPAAISQIALKNDDGTSSTDLSTSDPVVTGFVTDDGPLDAVVVEIDTNLDGFPDATTTVDASGRFEYRYRDLELGTIDLRFRSSERNPLTNHIVTGSWTDFTFELVSNSTIDWQLTDVHLANDTGSSSTDRVTEDPTIVGQVTTSLPITESYLVGLRFSDVDSLIGYVVVNADGTFRYTPVGLPFGHYDVQIVAAKFKHFPLDFVAGSVTTFSFDYLGADPVPTISQISVKNDRVMPFDERTTDPTLHSLISRHVPLDNSEDEQTLSVNRVFVARECVANRPHFAGFRGITQSKHRAHDKREYARAHGNTYGMQAGIALRKSSLASTTGYDRVETELREDGNPADWEAPAKRYRE